MPIYNPIAGNDGAAGPPGDEGIQGDEGIPGPPGTPGPQGSTGTAGVPGAAGPPGFAGEDGAEGERGPPGINGKSWPFDTASPRTWTVSQTSPNSDFNTIQAAINAAATGDTILVGPGTYAEVLTIASKNVVLCGVSSPSHNAANNVPVAVLVLNAFGVASGTCLTISGTSAVTIENMGFRATGTAPTTNPNIYGCEQNSSGGISTFVNCEFEAVALDATGTYYGFKQTAGGGVFVNCTLSGTDGSTPGTFAGVAVGCECDASVVSQFYSCSFRGTNVGIGSARSIRVNAATANIYLLGGDAGVVGGGIMERQAGNMFLVGLNYPAAFTYPFTGDTATDTNTTVTEPAYGLMRRDGQADAYKVRLRGLTTSPGAVGNGDIWLRSDVGKFYAQSGGAAKRLLNEDDDRTGAFLLQDPGDYANDFVVPVPGPLGPVGPTGSVGPVGPPVFLTAEEGPEGQTFGPPGPNLNPHSSVTTPAVPATTTAIVNTTGVPVTVYVKGGTLTVITVGGVATGITAAAAAGAAYPIPLSANQTIAITYTVAPTWVWVGV